MIPLPTKKSKSKNRKIAKNRVEREVYDLFLRMHQIQGLPAPATERQVLKLKARALAESFLSHVRLDGSLDYPDITLGGEELIDTILEKVTLAVNSPKNEQVDDGRPARLA